MNLAELSKLNEPELRERANACLKDFEIMSPMEKEHHVAEAQFYLTEIERRHQAHERSESARIARRDVWLELVVIFLIALEIVFSIVGIRLSYIEGNSQVKALDAMKTSLDNLNISTGKTAGMLAALANAQQDALETQKESLKTISRMNVAMQSQLDILRKDQQQRLAEAAKKPQLELTIGGLSLSTWRCPELR